MESVKQKIKNDIKKDIAESKEFSITMDEWTSIGNRRFLNISLHNACQKSIDLGLVRIFGSCNAKKKKKKRELVEEHLESFGLSFKHDIVSNTGDGASVMIKFGKESPAFYQTCLAHALHLAVTKTVYKEKSETEESIDKSSGETDDFDDVDNAHYKSFDNVSMSTSNARKPEKTMKLDLELNQASNHRALTSPSHGSRIRYRIPQGSERHNKLCRTIFLDMVPKVVEEVNIPDIDLQHLKQDERAKLEELASESEEVASPGAVLTPLQLPPPAKKQTTKETTSFRNSRKIPEKRLPQYLEDPTKKKFKGERNVPARNKHRRGMTRSRSRQPQDTLRRWRTERLLQRKPSVDKMKKRPAKVEGKEQRSKRPRVYRQASSNTDVQRTSLPESTPPEGRRRVLCEIWLGSVPRKSRPRGYKFMNLAVPDGPWGKSILALHGPGSVSPLHQGIGDDFSSAVDIVFSKS
ncbi:hypothetical protein X975_12308, partial [Stegodyphus mimosarum]